MKAAAYARFAALKNKHDIKAMKSPDYRWIYVGLSIKFKLKQNVLYYFPWMEKPLMAVYKGIKEFLRKK